MATLCEELTHWKRPWCWKGLGEGDDRRWDGWMASPTWWAWVWVNSGSWWWTGRPDVLRFMGSQRVGHNWLTELNCYLGYSLYSNFLLLPVISFKLSSTHLIPPSIQELIKDHPKFSCHVKLSWLKILSRKVIIYLKVNLIYNT